MKDGTLAVLLTFCGTVVMAISSVVVAIIINFREKKDSAAASHDKLNEQWRQFKDEQIADLKQELAEEKIKRADAEARADREKRRADHYKEVIDSQEQEQARDY